MITPKFHCRQDADYVYIAISVPHVKIKDIQIAVDGPEFTFYIKPYYLRLTFSHCCVEQADYCTQYDITKEIISVRLTKEQPGVEFQDLDMVTKLLTRRKLVEELDPEEGGHPDVDCTFEQKPVGTTETHAYYGFDNQFCNFFTPLQEQSTEVVDVPFPIDSTTPDSRKAMRLKQEQEHFDPDHYAADFSDDTEIQRLVEDFKPWYRPLWKLKQRERQERQAQSASTSDGTASSHNSSSSSSSLCLPTAIPLESRLAVVSQPKADEPRRPLITIVAEDGIPVQPPQLQASGPVAPLDDSTSAPVPPPDDQSRKWADTLGHDSVTEFTDEEHTILRNLPRRNYLLQNEHGVLCSLVDLLLAYTYDHITTEGEPTCESPWTIVKLSPTLCWLETHQTLHDVAVAFARRVCIFPLYRHFSIIQRCLKDVVMLLQSGLKVLVRVFLAIKQILQRGDWVYVLCKLYIDPYIVWLQAYSADKLHALGAQLLNVLRAFKKSHLNLNLPGIEHQCSLVAKALAEEGKNDGGGDSGMS